jgi:hypothetical protein
MSQNHRPPGTDIVQVLPPLYVINILTVCPLNEQRFTAHVFTGTDGRINTARKNLYCPLKKRMRIH